MKKSVWVTVAALLLCLLMVLPASGVGTDASSSQAANVQEIGAAIDEFLESHKDNHAAVAVAVFEGETDVYSRYFGTVDKDGQVPLDADSVLEWGSTTKLTVWVAAMQLWEKGLLDPDADLGTYLPNGFFKNLSFDTPITMMNLMNHNAGFQETTFVLEVESEDEIISLGEYLATYQPEQVFEPGTVVAYSNWGAALAGYVVECIAGVPFYQYAQENIFAPLGMTRTAIASDLSDNSYVQKKRREFVSYMPDGTLSEENNKVFILPYPAGMCTSTLSDFTTFAKALLNRDNRLLGEEGFAKLYSPSLLYTGTDKARLYHGFLVDYEFASPIVGHDGNTAGGSSRLLLDFENNRGMVVLTNQLGGSLYRTKMAELVFGKTEHNIPIDGYYVPARNVFEGKMKLLYNLFLIRHCHITSEMVGDMYINILPDRFEISTTDYLVPTENYWLRDGLAVAWFVLAGLALLSFVAHTVWLIIKRRRGQGLDRFNLFVGMYGLCVGLSLLAIIPEFPAPASLIWCGLLVIGGILLTVYLIIKRKMEKPNLLTKISYWHAWSLLLALAMTVLNYVIWDLML